jgi:hypothetical protein
MVKTQVQLEDWQYEATKKAGAVTSRSMSDIVREGLTLVLPKLGHGGQKPLAAIAGKYRPLSSQDLKDHDQGWVESIR